MLVRRLRRRPGIDSDLVLVDEMETVYMLVLLSMWKMNMLSSP